jgi:hypothetical protein
MLTPEVGRRFTARCVASSAFAVSFRHCSLARRRFLQYIRSSRPISRTTITIAAIIKPHGVELLDVVTGTVVVVVGRVVVGTVVVVRGVVVVVVVEVVVVVDVVVVVVDVVVVVGAVGWALPVPLPPNTTAMPLRDATSAHAAQKRLGTTCDFGLVPRSALILAFLVRSKGTCTNLANWWDPRNEVLVPVAPQNVVRTRQRSMRHETLGQQWSQGNDPNGG